MKYTLEDIKNMPYSSSFMNDRAELEINNMDYVKIGNNKWEKHSSQSHALSGTYTDTEIFNLLNEASDINEDIEYKFAIDSNASKTLVFSYPINQKLNKQSISTALKDFSKHNKWCEILDIVYMADDEYVYIRIPYIVLPNSDTHRLEKIITQIMQIVAPKARLLEDINDKEDITYMKEQYIKESNAPAPNTDILEKTLYNGIIEYFVDALDEDWEDIIDSPQEYIDALMDTVQEYAEDIIDRIEEDMDNEEASNWQEFLVESNMSGHNDLVNNLKSVLTNMVKVQVKDVASKNEGIDRAELASKVKKTLVKDIDGLVEHIILNTLKSDNLEEELDEDKSFDFTHDIYNALADIMFDYKNDNVSQDDVYAAVENFILRFWEEQGLDECMGTQLHESVNTSNRNKDVFTELLGW